jgi:PST family polysaccharide transporter
LESAEQQVPVLLLGRFSGTASIGQFRYAARMEASAGAVVVHSAAYVLFPAFARMTADRDRFRAAALRSLRGMALIGMPMGMMLVALGLPAAELAFGHEWKTAGYGAMVLSGMTTTGVVISFASEVLKADGRPDRLTRVRGLNLAVALVGMLALVPLGLIGVCAGLTIGTVAGAVYALVLVSDQLGLRVTTVLRQMAPTAGAATGMAAILCPLEFLVVQAGSRGTLLGVVLLLAEGLLGLTLYVIFLRLLSREHLDEVRDVAARLLPERLTRRAGSDQAAPPKPPEAEQSLR